MHQGIVDTFGSVGATSGVHTSVSVNTSDSVLQLRVAVDANNVGMVDLRIPARHQDHKRHLGTGLHALRPELPNSPARRSRDTRPASRTRDAGLVPLTLATTFKRPFPIPLQLVVPQVLARPRLDDWHEELARHVAQALQCAIRTGGFPCIEMIRGRPVCSQQIRHFIGSRRNQCSVTVICLQ